MALSVYVYVYTYTYVYNANVTVQYSMAHRILPEVLPYFRTLRVQLYLSHVRCLGVVARRAVGVRRIESSHASPRAPARASGASPARAAKVQLCTLRLYTYARKYRCLSATMKANTIGAH
jgi:hypothetical protein